jgi:hypothetical protein
MLIFVHRLQISAILYCFVSNAAHPSCMDYSVELTARIRADGGSWQCIDCKACVMCQDSGDAVSSKYPCFILLLIMNVNNDQVLSA